MILVFGSKGQLATSLKNTSIGSRAIFLGSDLVSFLEPEKIKQALDHYRPKLIINTSAYTAVEDAEKNRESCAAINVSAVKLMADWSKLNDSSLIHFSTDYVFSGEGAIPWKENDQINPINWYGQTKADSESAVVTSGCHHIIFRTSWLYSETGNCFVNTILKLGCERQSLSIVNDQIGSPTYALDLANVVSSLENNFRKFSGIYHIRGGGFTNWQDFAKEIFARARALGFSLRIESVNPVSTKDYRSLVQRPLNSRLNVEKFERDFKQTMPSWQDSLDRCLSKMQALS